MPARHYDAASRWIDSHHLGARLVYFRVSPRITRDTAPLRQELVLADLLDVKPGPFAEWIERELGRRADHVCAPTLEEFRQHQRAVTPAGQVRSGGGRHEKDDRRELTDRRNYVLGWDNHDKISRFLAEQDEVRGQLKVTEAQLAIVNENLGDLGRQNQQLGTVRSVAEFGEISWQLTARRIEELKSLLGSVRLDVDIPKSRRRPRRRR